MPQAVDKLHDKLVKDPDFKARYEELCRTKKGFKKKFPTLDSYAWAVANRRAGKAEAGWLKVESAAFVEHPERLAQFFSDAKVKNFLDTGSPDGVNSAMIITELTQLDHPSQHNDGTLHFVLSSEGAEETWRSLIGTPVHWVATASGHGMPFAPPRAIGTVIDVGVDRSTTPPRVVAALQLWDNDFPEEVSFIREIMQHLGASYEVIFDQDAVEERDDAIWIHDYVPTGLALLRRSRAAYPDMRVLAASAEIDEDIDDWMLKRTGGSDGGSQSDTGHLGNEGRREGDAGMYKATAEKWTTAYINSLPDSAFALVRKPVKDKARDRALPYKDKNGKIDPAHVRNALSRLPQVKGWSEAEKAKAKAKLERALKQVQRKNAAAWSKGAKVMDLSANMTAILSQVPEEFQPHALNILKAFSEEIESEALKAQEIEERDKQIGELKARLEAAEEKAKKVESEVKQLNAEKEEAERLRKIAEREREAEEEWKSLVAKGVYAEDDKEKILPLIAKMKAGESLTPEEVKLYADLRVQNGETEELDSETDTVKASDKIDFDKLREEAAAELAASGRFIMPKFKAKEGD